jgi:glycosyltransferase involved in cell wall biosynthesis
VIQLVAFSQYKLGGVQNFYFNILSHAPEGKFNIKWIFEDVDDNDPKLTGPYGIGEEVVFKTKGEVKETAYEMARRFQKLIPREKGVILANFREDLITLHLHPRPLKTIFFICHDEGYVPLAKEFEFLIDVFIAHNYQFYQDMISELPHRKGDIYFIPFGVKVPTTHRQSSPDGPLRIVIAARLQVSKGIYDLPVIDEMIKKQGVAVEWTIIGRGPEKEKLQSIVEQRGNFTFYTAARNEDVLAMMEQQDIFILPSRLDGLPVALLEAMSVGCVPVISRFNSGIERVVTPEIGFVLPVEDLQQFADTIVNLSKDRNDLQRRSRKAREVIEMDYNIEIQAKKYFDLFQRFEELKKPIRKKHHHYGGLLDYPFIPRMVRNFLRNMRGASHNSISA